MSDSIYANTANDASKISEWASNNIITIACSLDGKKLTKTIYPKYERAYDNAYYYKFFSREVAGLHDLMGYVKLLLHKPDCCLLRGVAKDDTISRQRRLFHSNGPVEPTIIEQDQNWFALDIDGYGESSGDLKLDTNAVLLALDLAGVEAFAIPSAGYLRKPGIRIRLFLWNQVKVNCVSLKKHFERYKSVVDLALFHPIQPIYTARPVFSGCDDPCVGRLWTWITGERMYCEVRKIYVSNENRPEEQYTKKQATNFFNKILREVFDIKEHDRHNWLVDKSTLIGKLIWQDTLIEEDVIEELYLATSVWKGNRRKDMQTILDRVKYGKEEMERKNGRF